MASWGEKFNFKKLEQLMDRQLEEEIKRQAERLRTKSVDAVSVLGFSRGDNFWWG